MFWRSFGKFVFLDRFKITQFQGQIHNFNTKTPLKSREQRKKAYSYHKNFKTEKWM